MTDKNKLRSNPPIDKTCVACKNVLLLSEFEIDESANDKRSDICKICSQHESENYGTCCQEHFEDMMIANTFNQLEILLHSTRHFENESHVITSPPPVLHTNATG